VSFILWVLQGKAGNRNEIKLMLQNGWTTVTVDATAPAGLIG